GLTRERIASLPKVEVHSHIDGAVFPEDIWNIAQRNSVRLHVGRERDGRFLASLDDTRRFFGTDDGRPHSYNLTNGAEFDLFLNRFGVTLSLMQTPDTIRDVVRHFVLDAASRGVVYLEGRFAPRYSTVEGLTIPNVVDAAVDGVRQAMKESGGILAKLILCVGREEKTEAREQGRRDTTSEVIETAMDFSRSGNVITGIDLACNEIAYPPDEYVDDFAGTFHNPLLRRTIHAGEVAPTREQAIRNMRVAVSDMRADGLGHALPIMDDEDLLDEVVRKGIRIERSPYSNLCSGLINDSADLRTDELLRRGVKVVVSSDDQAIFNADVNDNLAAVCAAHDFGVKEFAKLQLNGVTTAFCTAGEAALVKKLFKDRGLDLEEVARAA
ncbi:MAG: hypothetical protein AAB592_04840, partial [Patescibacteria group bacterium]